MSRPIICYPAGSYARNNILRWEKEGLKPVCFADLDKNKWGLHFSSTDQTRESSVYEILPLNAAIAKYPDYLLYVTADPANRKAIYDFLVEQDFPIERIAFPDNTEWRKGCFYLGKTLQLSSNSILFCCGPTEFKTVVPYLSEEPFEEVLARYEAEKKKLIDAIRKGIPTKCDGCPIFEEDFYEINPKTDLIQLVASRWKGQHCNMQCSYCFVESELLANNDDVDVVETIHHIERIYGKNELKYEFSMGELTVGTFCNDVLQILLQNNRSCLISSNAGVFSSDINKLLELGLAYLVISLDSGTPETFERIKGRNWFERVTDNIRKYSNNGTQGSHICLKYIFLDGVNDNIKDVDGFVYIAKKYKTNVAISGDQLKIPTTANTEQTFEMITRLYHSCVAEGIGISYTNFTFGYEDNLRLKKLFGEV